MKFVVSQCNVMTRIINADSAIEALNILKETDFRYTDYWQHGNMLYDPKRQDRKVFAWEYEED